MLKRKVIALVFVFIMLFSLTACTTTTTPGASSAPNAGNSASAASTSAANTSAANTSTAGSSTKLQGEYKIGVLLPLTGTKASGGQDAKKGMEIGIEMINEQGGVQGKKLVAVFADGKDANAGIAEAQRLIEIEKVACITGTYEANVSYAVSAICEQNKKFFFEMASPADALLQRGFKYVFRMNPTASDEGTFGVNFFCDKYKELGVASAKDIKFALIGIDSVYGQSIYNGAKNRLTELGITPVFAEHYAADTTDLASLIMKLKEAKPDVCICASSLEDSALFYRQAYELGFYCKGLLGNGAGFGNKTFYDRFGSLADYLCCTNYTIRKSPKEFAPDLEAFFQRYKKTYNQEPVYEFLTAQICQGTLVLAKILNAAKDMNSPDSLVQSALAIDIPANTMINGWGAKFAGPDAKMPGQNICANNLIIAQWQKGSLYQVYPSESEGIDIVFPLPTWDKRK